jgi:hypothetical protein
MNHPKVIANSFYWQEYILKASHDPKQRERALKAIERLKAELNQARTK